MKPFIAVGVIFLLQLVANVCYARLWRSHGWRAGLSHYIREVNLSDPKDWSERPQERAERMAIITRISGYGAQNGRRAKRNDNKVRLIRLRKQFGRTGAAISPTKLRTVVPARVVPAARVHLLQLRSRRDTAGNGEVRDSSPLGRVPRPAGERIPSSKES